MGFFSQTGAYSTATGDYELAEAGAYICRLKEVVTEDRPGYDDSTILQPQYKFVFETTQTAATDGRPFRFTRFTGVKYGNDSANLTKLLDQMLGKRLTEDEFRQLDLRHLMAREYRLVVDEHTTQAGKPVNKIVSVKALARMNEVTARQTVAEARPQAAERQASPAPRGGTADDEAEDLSDLSDPFAE